MNDSMTDHFLEEFSKNNLNLSNQNNSLELFQGNIEDNIDENLKKNYESSPKSINTLLKNVDKDLSEFDNIKTEFTQTGQNVTRPLSTKISKKTQSPTKNSSEDKKFKSMRSKNFLIPLDPNSYKVDMNELKKKFISKDDKRKIDRIDSLLILKKSNLEKNANLSENTIKLSPSDKGINKNNAKSGKKDSFTKMLSHNEIERISDNNKGKISKVNLLLEKFEKKKRDIENSMNEEKKQNPPIFKKPKEESKSLKKIENQYNIRAEKFEKKNILPQIDKAIEEKIKNRVSHSLNKYNNVKKNESIDNKSIDSKLKIHSQNTPISTNNNSKNNETENFSRKKTKSYSEKKNNLMSNKLSILISESKTDSTNSPNKKNEQKFEQNGKEFPYPNLKKRIRCTYCIKRLVSPLLLSCNHIICYTCAHEIQSISSYLLKKKQDNILCSKCEIKTSFLNLNELKINNWKDPEQIKSQSKNIKTICDICPSSKIFKEIGEFECLNCDILCCYDCKVRHVSRHNEHKIIQITEFLQEKIELTLCEMHREPLKFYCCKDEIPFCHSCLKKYHETHQIKELKTILDTSNNELNEVLKENENKIKFINGLTQELVELKAKLNQEMENFLKKLKDTIDSLTKEIKQKEKEIENKIKNIFEKKIRQVNEKLDLFLMISDRYTYYKNLICDVDIDIVERIKQIKKFNQKIQNLEKIEKSDFESKLIFKSTLKNSLFTTNPKVSNILTNFNFYPVSDHNIESVRSIFNSSTTIPPNLITSEFLLIFPKLISGSLLYRTSRDGTSPYTFHKHCDNKGATVLIVRTVEGMVFGGFNPLSWVSEHMYMETDHSFLFSLSDGKSRKPLKCPVKKCLKKYAIRQNNLEHSPGFGEMDNSDLQIVFKNLKSSYSNLGNVYKCPEGHNPEEFFAGKNSDWKIQDVEVYSLETAYENYEKEIF